jgi:hypothetical protein
MPYHRACNKNNTMGGTYVADISYPSVAPEVAPDFLTWINGVRVVHFVFTFFGFRLRYDFRVKRCSVRPY